MLQPALYARFLQGLAMAPRRAALRLDRETYSYEAVHETALRWAGALVSGCRQPPQAVGVLAGKGIEGYAGILAALYAGAAVVPLHPDFPVARTRRMMEAAGVSALIADAHGLAAAARIAEGDSDLPVLSPDGPDDGRFRRITVSRRTGLHEPLPVVASDIAYILYTSGTTGRPKGVPITHGNTHHYFTLLDSRYDFDEHDVFSQTFDLTFDCAMFDLFCAWGAGASVRPVPAHAYRDLPAFVAERGLTVWFSTPSAIALVRRARGLPPGGMPGLRWSLFAGEALQASDVVAWQEAAPGCTVENIYGPTELTITVTGHRWSPATSPARCVNGLVPIGTVHEGHDHVLLDQCGEDSDSEGELCVTGPQMAAGYLDPRDDEGRFLRRDGRTWYRTGDRVRRMDNGELAHLGRLDTQVQVRGWRVELTEIEHALRTCDGVEDAVTVARPGDNGTELVVFYTGTRVPAAELARGLRTLLPQGMTPRHYRHIDVLPLNSNRKVDRARLALAAREQPLPG
ncbi:D-alanine--poly(phosphoribitol) ligase [Streptomyces chlorus]|uniref:AMP-binding protein n=1 Tax=Streptomyces chlorus TaxID=887452 RepID=A0ABW1E879_9ACTN